jgi:carbamoyltransferase
MKILGLNAGEFNTSASILVKGNITAAVQEERFTRNKFTKEFPYNSIKYCLAEEKLKISDLDAISFGWNPSAHMTSYNEQFSKNRILRENNFYAMSDNLFNLSERNVGDFTLVKHGSTKNMPEIFHVQHHLCHASAAFFLSNFDEAAILTADFKGETQCTTWSYGHGNKIKIIDFQNIPDSLGIIYATFTQLLGYKADSDEWKVMAMSAHKVNCNHYIKKIKSTYTLLKNGKLKLNKNFYGFFSKENKYLYTSKLLKLLNVKKVFYTNNPSERDILIAKALQFCAEEIAIHFLKHLYKLTKCKNLVLGGGFFMNSVFNGKISEKTNFKNIYISYAPTDTGNSIGSSLFTYHCIKKYRRKLISNTALLGPKYSNKYIESVLIKRKVKYKKIVNHAKVISKECFNGGVVAYFRNRLEFGDRSLGCRSIIADPRFEKTKDLINASIKYREKYRPFAPSVIEEKADKFFEVKQGYKCKYMEKVIKVKAEFRKKLSAVTHYDGTGRLQTVSKKENLDFYNILSEFEKLSGYPILLNTSFNMNGEPVVNSPDDALNTFFNCKLKTMVIGNFLIKK